ncbi:MAG: DUF389 domain-containing protein [Fibrobacteria bacterium]
MRKILSLLLRLRPHISEIREGTDFQGTIEAIESQATIRGFNIWILVCAAFLASLGLDTNSVAVIIGAMLISPLMNPILGVGLGLGINDKEMLANSLKALASATLVSLGASTVYFLITPLGETTAEILARTRPTVLDVLVAIFGGTAGIISVSRKIKTNAIPGVAIATALMPPLCTAGFGIAKGRWDIFFGGFYLFFINAVFISLVTFTWVKFLEFPQKTYNAQSQNRRVKAAMAAILLAVVVTPSVYFLLNVYKEIRTKKAIENFVQTEIRRRGDEVLKWEIIKTDSIPELKVLISGKAYHPKRLDTLERKMKLLGLQEFGLKVYPVSLSREEVQRMSSEITSNYLSGIELRMKSISAKPETVIVTDTLPKPARLAAELKAIHPDIQAVAMGKMAVAGDSGNPYTAYTVILDWRRKARKKTPLDLDARVKAYLRTRLQLDSLIIVNREG